MVRRRLMDEPRTRVATKVGAVSGSLPLLPEEFSVCPRCNSRHDGRFYGPCEACRVELRTTMGVEARHVDVAEYEPKMNVTPNAVALKDD